jgi:DNA-binding response OmpR family regulator
VETKAIVIVEDNEPIARLLQEVLNDVPGYGAVTVLDAAIALDVIAAVHPHLVVSDIDLPGISGFELLDLLRRDQRTAAVPVLFMSAAIHGAEAARRGVPFLAKPFDLDDFLDQVNALLRSPLDAAGSQPPSPHASEPADHSPSA